MVDSPYRQSPYKECGWPHAPSVPALWYTRIRAGMKITYLERRMVIDMLVNVSEV